MIYSSPVKSVNGPDMFAETIGSDGCSGMVVPASVELVGGSGGVSAFV